MQKNRTRTRISSQTNQSTTDSASKKLIALHEGLANMAVDSLYPSERGIEIATSYAQGQMTHPQAVSRILQFHGVTPA